MYRGIAQCAQCAMSKVKFDPYEINQKVFPQSEQERGDHEHTKLKKPPPLREGPNKQIIYVGPFCLK